MSAYAGVLSIFIMAIGFGALFIWASSVLGPKRPNPVKMEPFECGESPLTKPGGQMPVKFYLVAMLFIIFDVELIFLFPWAVIYRKLGAFGFFELLPFMAILIIGLAYAWQQGALDWHKSDY